MKPTNSLEKVKSATIADLDVGMVRKAVHDALGAVDDARQRCLAAGQLLNDAKAGLDHGDFGQWLSQNLPELPERTARCWMGAARNVVRALPPVPGSEGSEGAEGEAIDVETVSVSEILTRPEEELPASAREWKQLWMDFTQDKTIKECLAGVFVDGDPAHRVDRAVNGKTKGGAGGDRKDFPFFIARKLAQLDTHLGHWDAMSPVQQTEALNVLVAAIAGDRAVLRERTRPDFEFAGWPAKACEVLLESLKARRGRSQGTGNRGQGTGGMNQ